MADDQLTGCCWSPFRVTRLAHKVFRVWVTAIGDNMARRIQVTIEVQGAGPPWDAAAVFFG
jgi:hypothetical protein